MTLSISAHEACLDGDMAMATSAQDLRRRFESEALPHLKSLYGTACRLTGNRHDAEDLVQETLLRAFRAFATYEPGTNIRGWLFKIVYRVRIDGFRRGSRRPRTVALVEDPRSTPPPQDALAGGQEQIARALETVPELYRTAVILRDIEDLSYGEIADVLSVPIGTVMSRIHRGRSLLRSAVLPETGLDTPMRE
jgi:RNA polymerase sigma-70 factor (ECF subfamily)